MSEFLHDVLPERTWRNRLQRENGRAYMEFGPTDVEHLHRLGIEVDHLGPRLVVCMWDDESPLEVGGYLVVDNLAMGRPAMGGIRMLPDVTPSAIHSLARGMTLKNAAAALPYGGGKSGIVADPGVKGARREEIIRRFARLIHRYHELYLPGPDVGTDDADMKIIAIENGLDCVLSKPAEMGGNRIDELGAAAGGVVIAIHTLLEEMPRLRALPQFADLQVPSRAELTVLIQGFGAVGSHVARMLATGYPGKPPGEAAQIPRILGVSDETGYLFSQDGLPVEELLRLRAKYGTVALHYFLQHLEEAQSCQSSVKFSTARDDLLRESAFCFVPAAPVANYLAVDAASHPCMTVDRMGRWRMIVEGANTYSPDPARKAARARMERAVYWQAGVLIATDYLVNSGGVIFAAQEHAIRTPEALRIPPAMLGDQEAVVQWLEEHRAQFQALAEQRRLAGEAKRDEVIRRNIEMIDLLVSDPDMLPCEAAERISIGRIASSERYRTVADIMEPLPTIVEGSTVGEAAQLLIETKSDMLAVISTQGKLVGVVTDWDITRASAETGGPQDMPLAQVMTQEVVSVSPEASILDVVHKLEYHEISAMPVVREGRVLGVISGDILARRTLYRLLQAQG